MYAAMLAGEVRSWESGFELERVLGEKPGKRDSRGNVKLAYEKNCRRPVASSNLVEQMEQRAQ